MIDQESSTNRIVPGNARPVKRRTDYWQIAARFLIGFLAGALMFLAFMMIAKNKVTTVQTPESEPHQEVFYAGLEPGAFLILGAILPFTMGAFALFVPMQRLPKTSVWAMLLLAIAAQVMIIWVGLDMLNASIWFGFD